MSLKPAPPTLHHSDVADDGEVEKQRELLGVVVGGALPRRTGRRVGAAPAERPHLPEEERHVAQRAERLRNVVSKSCKAT